VALQEQHSPQSSTKDLLYRGSHLSPQMGNHTMLRSFYADFTFENHPKQQIVKVYWQENKV